jgi:hypothetical protein
MKNRAAFICLITILIGTNIYIVAQNKSDIKPSANKKYVMGKGKHCAEVEVNPLNELENLSLPNKEKYDRAKMDAKCIAPYEVEKLQALPKPDSVQVVHLFSSDKCDEFKPEKSKSNYVVFLSELKEFYQSHKNQFSMPQERLKQLIGSDDTYQCLVVIEIGAEYLERPTDFTFDDDGKLDKPLAPQPNRKKTDNYPDTNLGYTCDWHYGDGCRTGLSEFTWFKIDAAKKANKLKVSKPCEINKCADSVLGSVEKN